jgi:hypothetical protein
MNNYPTVDDSFERLHRAGWSVGDVATSEGWCVNGTKGENRLEVFALTQAANPDRRPKIAAACPSSPRPAHVGEAHRGTKHAADTRAKMSEAHRKRGTRPPAGRPARHRVGSSHQQSA